MGVGVVNGLEAEYQPRGPMVYVRDPADEGNAFVRVSMARWSRFLASIKAGVFTPQQEGDEVTITIGDLANAGIVKCSPYLVTTRHTWDTFVKAVKGGEFDPVDAVADTRSDE
ncbi:hypothetical protein N5079_22215 [Planotetraspora sp. A-T 1434]|uniref:hypothetical protein n=1 Tax=Planotetraspora sp. A-T 1434 TaxID=2979219 RepID=UPI0021BE0957|nr:hypothetical protein [Planotetraspora sp. A-T 1434]MCT9932926.1 hypothetical protein [Planotetraspora sp. A-T 1434]